MIRSSPDLVVRFPRRAQDCPGTWPIQLTKIRYFLTRLATHHQLASTAYSAQTLLRLAQLQCGTPCTNANRFNDTPQRPIQVANGLSTTLIPARKRTQIGSNVAGDHSRSIPVPLVSRRHTEALAPPRFHEQVSCRILRDRALLVYKAI